ncbi:CsiV family protein [Oceanospirillum sanctuarii]|uniref:CsiV family protein n=1 Tax=Oceanospirillum sanctuarii TaxID=1434821 RepID=UPI0015939884|nr:CsiV family protein [Oceanospirillum sanctuarii]
MNLMTRSQNAHTNFLKSALCQLKGKSHSLITASLLLMATAGTPSFAEDNAAPEKAVARHYTVEMIIFSYEEQDKTLSESWPENVQVELPNAYLKLYRPTDVTPELLAKTEQEVQTRVQTKENGETELIETPVGIVPLSNQQRADLANNRLPDLFYMPEDKMQLIPQRNRLERRKNFRIMFHEAWNMPVYDRANSTPIHIRGGEQYDNLFELEGSINLSVARYLHLDTNLYLREFEASQSSDQTNVPGFSELLSNKNSSTAILPSSNLTPNPSLALLGFRQYRVDTIIPMQQSRRMRSGDLHYIDHPRYGILIQLTPYNAEEEPIALR